MPPQYASSQLEPLVRSRWIAGHSAATEGRVIGHFAGRGRVAEYLQGREGGGGRGEGGRGRVAGQTWQPT